MAPGALGVKSAETPELEFYTQQKGTTMTNIHVAFDDSTISTRDIEARVAFIEGALTAGIPQSYEGEAEDYEAEVAAWKQLKANYGDAKRWEEGVTLVLADDEDNLPVDFVQDEYENSYDETTVTALAPYVDWAAVAAAFVLDYRQLSVTDHEDNSRTYFARG